MVDCICVHLTRSRGAHIAGQMLFLSVSVRVFLEAASVGIRGLSKAESPPGEPALSSPSGPEQNTKQKKGNSL